MTSHKIPVVVLVAFIHCVLVCACPHVMHIYHALLLTFMKNQIFNHINLRSGHQIGILIYFREFNFQRTWFIFCLRKQNPIYLYSAMWRIGHLQGKQSYLHNPQVPSVSLHRDNAFMSSKLRKLNL